MQAVPSFRFYHLKIAAKRLPGRGFRLDPLAVVHVGRPGAWQELGRTEKRLNEWNPKFAQNITLPADSNQQRAVDIRVDFYHKAQEESRFLGFCEVNFYAIIEARGTAVELVLQTPEPDPKSPRVFLTGVEGSGIGSDQEQVNLSMQLMQTNFYGVAMKMYYEICRASNGAWLPVFSSPHIKIDDQGFGQFPECKISMRDLTMDEKGAGLLIHLYRHKRLGTKKLLGSFQTSVRDLERSSAGTFIPFTPNAKESLVAADVQVLYAKKAGAVYSFSLKLINVHWNATLLTADNVV